MLKGPAGQVQRKLEARIGLRVNVPLIGDKPVGKVRLARAGNTPQHHQPSERLVDTHSSYSYSTATAAKHPPKALPERRMGLRRACVELPGDGNRRTLANLGGQVKSDLENH